MGRESEGLCWAGAHCRDAQHADVGVRADERHARAVRVCERRCRVRTTGASSRGYISARTKASLARERKWTDDVIATWETASGATAAGWWCPCCATDCGPRINTAHLLRPVRVSSLAVAAAGGDRRPGVYGIRGGGIGGGP